LQKAVIFTLAAGSDIHVMGISYRFNPIVEERIYIYRG
jgi:hypothetical protein